MVFIDPPRADLVLGRARAFFKGRRGGSSVFGRMAAFAGPTFLAAVAYLDPGNFATNITAGATHGYQLLWVVLVANVMAMLFQALSAKLGIVSGRSLPRVCHERLRPGVTFCLWVVSEIGAMATDLAELLGAAVALSLLFGTSLLTGTLLAGGLSWVILSLHETSFRTVEALVTLLVLVIGVCFVVELNLLSPDWAAIAFHAVTPSLDGPHSVMLAAGIVGATVMPHAVFLHSSVARNRLPAGGPDILRRLVRASNIDIAFTMGAVGLVNMAIMCVAAVTFGAAATGTEPSIEDAYRMLGPLFGGMAAGIFLVSLLASGLSSSVVGTMAGQVIMQDFVEWRIPLWVRRLATMLPTIIAAAFMVDVTKTLVISQVVLSFVLPVPLITLVMFTGSRAVMGELANSRRITVAAIGATVIVLALNGFLLLDLLTFR